MNDDTLSKTDEPGARGHTPGERIDHDAGLSPGALQTGAAAGAAIGGGRGTELPSEPAEKDTD